MKNDRTSKIRSWNANLSLQALDERAVPARLALSLPPVEITVETDNSSNNGVAHGKGDGVGLGVQKKIATTPAEELAPGIAKQAAALEDVIVPSEESGPVDSVVPVSTEPDPITPAKPILGATSPVYTPTVDPLVKAADRIDVISPVTPVKAIDRIDDISPAPIDKVPPIEPPTAPPTRHPVIFLPPDRRDTLPAVAQQSTAATANVAVSESRGAPAPSTPAATSDAMGNPQEPAGMPTEDAPTPPVAEAPIELPPETQAQVQSWGLPEINGTEATARFTPFDPSSLTGAIEEFIERLKKDEQNTLSWLLSQDGVVWSTAVLAGLATIEISRRKKVPNRVVHLLTLSKSMVDAR